MNATYTAPSGPNPSMRLYDGTTGLFVANDKMDNSFFHNQRKGKFQEMAFDAGVALEENGRFISGMGVDFRDIDNDGLPDIAVVALDNETFPLFRNIGKGGFRDITGTSGMARLSVPMAGYWPRRIHGCRKRGTVRP